MFLVVGLGNPGEKYLFTRHNIGFIILDKLAKVLKKEFKKKDNFLFFKSKNLIGAKPLTFMNESGKAVKKMKEFFDIDVKDILVVVDDFNIDFGTIRYRTRGSAGGHNGLKSIIRELQDANFPRLRIGIGPVRSVNSLEEFVLSNFSKTELENLSKIVDETISLIFDFKNVYLPDKNFTVRILNE